ncbi:MAG: S1 family peptidase, partial [Micromonosporaceae bacterium]
MRLPALSAAVITAVLFAAPVPASADDRPTPPKHDVSSMIDAMRRDLDLTAKQARLRLAYEAAASLTEKRVRTTLGKRFAGAWYDADAHRLAAGVVHKADAGKVRAAGAVPKRVDRTHSELNAVKKRLDRSASEAPGGVHGWYVDVVRNRVTIAATSSGAARKLITASGVEATAVRIVTSDDAPRTVYDIRGGDQYGIDNRVLCSVGFSVAGGFVT